MVDLPVQPEYRRNRRERERKHDAQRDEVDLEAFDVLALADHRVVQAVRDAARPDHGRERREVHGEGLDLAPDRALPFAAAVAEVDQVRNRVEQVDELQVADQLRGKVAQPPDRKVTDDDRETRRGRQAREYDY